MSYHRLRQPCIPSRAAYQPDPLAWKPSFEELVEHATWMFANPGQTFDANALNVRDALAEDRAAIGLTPRHRRR